MIRKISLSLIWLTFVIYAFIFAPPNNPDTLDLIKNLSTGNLTGINAYIIALFNLMGILPAMYGCFLFADGRGQKIPAWLFLSASFFLGAFALIPYLILRENNQTFVGQKNWLIKFNDSRILGLFLTITAIILLIFGISQGNWQDFILQWKTSRFINVMSLDFCLLSLLFTFLLKDDLVRRNMNNYQLWLISFIPLFGTLIYLCFRQPLPENE